MLTVKLTPKQSEVIKYFAENGLTHGYAFHPKKGKIMGAATWDKARKHLVKTNLIEFKEKAESKPHKGKIVDLYGLTWKGLLYSLKENYINAEEAYIVRKKNKLIIPFLNDKHPLFSAEDIEAIKEMRRELGMSNKNINPPSDKEIIKVVENQDLQVIMDIIDDIEKILSKKIYIKFLTNVLTGESNSDLDKELLNCLITERQLIRPKDEQFLMEKYPLLKTLRKKQIKQLRKSLAR